MGNSLYEKNAKIIRRILIILLTALILFTLVTFVIHRVNSSNEIELLKEKGYYNPISVGDYSITEIEMTSALENDNMVVYIDRAGYGLSDDTDNEIEAVVFLDGTQLSDSVFDENTNGSIGFFRTITQKKNRSLPDRKSSIPMPRKWVTVRPFFYPEIMPYTNKSPRNAVKLSKNHIFLIYEA